jgi:hypothetical protein
LKWVPNGVPKIGHRYDNCVFYLYRTNPKSGKIEGPLGTGFFVFKFGEGEPGKRGVHYYGITNHHVAVALGASMIRINTKGGGTRFLPFETEDWHFLPGGLVDLCAVDIDMSNFQPDDEWKCVSEYSFLCKDEAVRLDIGFGENTFMIGLFVSHHGGSRNVPSARFGNVAMMADDNTPISTEGNYCSPCHLIDMRSRSGFSGSPVFIYRTPVDDLSPQYQGRPIDTKKNLFSRFFGVHCSQFQEPIKIRTVRKLTEGTNDAEIVESTEIGEAGDPIGTGDRLIIPSSMTIVVPSWRVSELLNLEVFEMARKARHAERERREYGEASRWLA